MMWLTTRSRHLLDIPSRILRTRQQAEKTGPDLPLVSLLAALIVAFVIRYCTVAQHIDMGQDVANYLSTTNTVFGNDVLGLGVLRPPLIALVVKPFTLLFGDLTGVKVLGVLLSTALGIPFYLLAKRLCRPWVAVAVTLVFVFTPDYSDLLAWGYLTMFGVLFTMFALYFLLRLLEKASKLNVFLTGASVSLVAGFHQLSLAFFVFMVPLLVIALAVSDRQRLIANWRPLLAAVVVAVLLSLPYLPIYLRLAHLQAAAESHQAISFTPLAQIRSDLSFGTTVSFVPWFLGMILLPSILGIVALKWTWEQDRRIAASLAAVLLYSLILTVFLLPPPFAELNRRAHYFLNFPLWLLAGVFLSKMWSRQDTLASTARRLLPLVSSIIILALIPTTAFLSQVQLHHALDFYGYLDDARRDAVVWVADNTPREATVVAYPESLGWWIESEARRQTANVADRDTVPLTPLRERSLAADRILSRNQGIENGNLRMATTYPYSGAPGSPVLAVYSGGYYQDIMMFDESLTRLATDPESRVALSSASKGEVVTTGDASSRTMATSYQVGSAVVTLAVKLDRGTQAAVVTCQVERNGSAVTRLDIPVLFAIEPQSVEIDPGGYSTEVVQILPGKEEQVRTQITVAAAGLALSAASYQSGQLQLSFDLQSDEATLTFHFLVAEPSVDRHSDVTSYRVSDTLAEYSIDYIAVDLSPNPNLANALSPATRQWLDSCPYYDLVYPSDRQGYIRIYQVATPG